MIQTEAHCTFSDVLNVVSARSLLLSFYIFCIQTYTSECFAVRLDYRGQNVNVQLRNVKHLTLAPSSLSGDSLEFEGVSCSVLELINVTQILPQHRLSRSLWIFQEWTIGSWYQLRPVVNTHPWSRIEHKRQIGSLGRRHWLGLRQSALTKHLYTPTARHAASN